MIFSFRLIPLRKNSKNSIEVSGMKKKSLIIDIIFIFLYSTLLLMFFISAQTKIKTILEWIYYAF